MNKHLANLKQQLLADKKKLGAMILLAVFGLLLWGRLLLKDVPRTATADPKPAQTASKPTDNATPPPTRSQKVEIVRIDPQRRLSRDLFNFDPNRYNRTVITPDSGNLFESGNSGGEATDELLSVNETLDQARRLELQSVLTGARARAVINGVLLGPGERVEGFELLEVVDRYVHLERNGIVIRLWM